MLRSLYFAEQQLAGFLVMKSMKATLAKQMLPKLLALLRQFEQSSAKALAATLISWLEAIVRMWRFSKRDHRGVPYQDGNNVTAAYGYRNFENYCMRVLAQCGRNGIISRA
jgi:transposase